MDRIKVITATVVAAVLVLAGGVLAGGVLAATSTTERDTERRPAALHAFRQGPIRGLTDAPDRDELAGRGSGRGPLLLFLPATGAEPGNYTALLGAAVGAGYHVLGLNYWNLGSTLSSTCRRSSHCYTVVQRNRFDGHGPSSLSRVAQSGSIVVRVRTALRYLTARDPSGGWDRYLLGDAIRWQRVVVAGHSQGGSEAAYIAHVRRVHGLLMFGAPAIGDRIAHADWLDRPGRTPMVRAYALVHAADRYRRRIEASLRLLAIPGSRRPTLVGVAAPPVGVTGDHVLVTDVVRGGLPARGAAEGAGSDVGDARASGPPTAHQLVAADRTPRDAVGAPRLLGVWQWMLERCG